MCTITESLSRFGDKVFSIGGATGVGKDTVAKALIRKHPSHIIFFPRSTTRRKRDREIPGIDYHFIDDATFAERERLGYMSGVDEHKGSRYGLDVQLLAQTVHQIHNGHRILMIGGISGIELKSLIPDMTNIFLAASIREIETRLREREHDGAVLADRLRWAEEQLKESMLFDHTVNNPQQHPESAVNAISVIMRLYD